MEASLNSLIDRFINWRGKGEGEIEHFSGEEFLEILEEMLKKEQDLKAQADRYGVTSDGRLHRYTIACILEPLIGKMKYGKRISN